MPRWNPAHIALRVTAGAFILNTGIGKWSGDEKQAAGVHGMAKGTYPFLDAVAPQPFLKGLAAGEIALAAALLTPFVPAAVAGAGLTGFAASLLGLYLRTPGMHSNLRPTQQGTPIAKDLWLLGMGAALLADGVRKKA